MDMTARSGNSPVPVNPFPGGTRKSRLPGNSFTLPFAFFHWLGQSTPFGEEFVSQSPATPGVFSSHQPESAMAPGLRGRYPGPSETRSHAE